MYGIQNFSKLYLIKLTILCSALVTLLMAACSGGGEGRDNLDPGSFNPMTTPPVEISVTSPDFQSGGDIPARFTCDGEDVSPEIEWSELPRGTEAVAVIVDDPDAPGGIFSHWVIYNLPPETRRLSSGVPGDERLDNGAMQGINDFGDIGYGGPCPPSGPAHQYRFLVFVLNAPLALEPGATSEEVIAATQGSVIGYGELSGMYARR